MLKPHTGPAPGMLRGEREHAPVTTSAPRWIGTPRQTFGGPRSSEYTEIKAINVMA
jgi:hypothetical protein